MIAAERFCRSYWTPSFRYTIRYENGLVGMDMKNIVENSPYHAVDNNAYAEQQQPPQTLDDESQDLDSDSRLDEVRTASLRGSQEKISSRGDKSPSPWASETQPLKKKYVVVYSQPPGVVPEDMQLISTV